MPRILAIDGSYRKGGLTDQAVAAVARGAEQAGAEVETVYLRDTPIAFCRNCRECTQQPGEAPGECVQEDAMQALVARIEAADGYILASPTNIGSVTALFKRFMERLVVYTYWPWGQWAPRPRKAKATKKAVLISSCAAPGWLGRWLFDTRRGLKTTARILGARPVGTLFLGFVSQQPQTVLSDKAARRAEAWGRRLAKG